MYSGNEAFFNNKKLDKNQDLYYIYRNSCLKKDKPLFSRSGVRYDLTVITPGLVGRETHRTIGHIHKNLSRTGRPPEIYQVIYGSAIFLIQNNTNHELYAIYRSSGQKIIIPPDCGHITANASLKTPLVIANIFVDRNNASDYSFFKKTSGPAWYPIWNKGKLIFERNPRQKKYYSLKKIKTYGKLPLDISKTAPLYEEFIKNPEKFLFLTEPKRFTSKLVHTF